MPGLALSGPPSSRPLGLSALWELRGSRAPGQALIRGLSLLPGLALAEYDQPYGGLLDILRGGTERLFTNLKDTSSKVIQSVAK